MRWTPRSEARIEFTDTVRLRLLEGDMDSHDSRFEAANRRIEALEEAINMKTDRLNKKIDRLLAMAMGALVTTTLTALALVANLVAGA